MARGMTNIVLAVNLKVASITARCHPEDLSTIFRTFVWTFCNVFAECLLVVLGNWAQVIPISNSIRDVTSVMLLGVSGAQSSQQAQQQKVFVDLQKLVETQEREVRARRDLEVRLEEARRNNRKFQTELQQAQKEAESYKGRLQAIHKDTDAPDQESTVIGISGVSSESAGAQLARQLFMQPGSLEGLGTGNVNVMTADAVDMLTQVAQGSPSVAQVVVAETVVDEGDITCGVPPESK